MPSPLRRIAGYKLKPVHVLVLAAVLLGGVYLVFGAITPCGILKVRVRDRFASAAQGGFGSDLIPDMVQRILWPEIDQMSSVECLDRLSNLDETFKRLNIPDGSAPVPTDADGNQ